MVPATQDERRFLVLNVSDAKLQDANYFSALAEQMYDQGGVEAMMYDLMQYDYDLSKLRNPPKTIGLADQVAQSLNDVYKFWWTVLARGYLLTNRETGGPGKAMQGQDEAPWPTFAWKFEIYDEFLFMFSKARHKEEYQEFWNKTWGRDVGWLSRDEMRSRKRLEGERFHGMKMGTLSEMRRTFTGHFGIEFEDEGSDDDDDELVPF